MKYDWNEILGWFSEDPSKIEEPTEIIYAEYEDGGYDGQVWVLFYDNGKFWYVEGSHCSCYGLEDQWSPEEYAAETLAGQVERASYGFFKDQKGLIMAAIEKYQSPISVVAGEYGQVQVQLQKAREDLMQAEARVDALDQRETELREKLKLILK